MITSLDTNSALILIDLQKGIVKNPTAHPIQNVLSNVQRLIDAFRKEHLPIVIVNVQPAAAIRKPVRSDLPPPIKNPDALPADFTEIVPEIQSTGNDIFVTKHTWNAFYETPLDEELKKRNVTGIVLAGISTSIGVEGTARSANERRYNISFAVDAMTDRVLQSHEHSLEYIFPRIGEIGTTADIVAALVQRR